jgi:hypothetical protein
MKGRQLFFLALERPRQMCSNPPFSALVLVADVAAYIDLVKVDIARMETLSDIGAQITEPLTNSTLDLMHPTRRFLERSILSRLSPLQAKLVTIYL